MNDNKEYPHLQIPILLFFLCSICAYGFLIAYNYSSVSDQYPKIILCSKFIFLLTGISSAAIGFTNILTTFLKRRKNKHSK